MRLFSQPETSGGGSDLPVFTFASDLPQRSRFFVPESMWHPAKCHLGLVQYLVDHYTRSGDRLCDPLAGSGSLLLAALSVRSVIARDIEERWVEVMGRNADRIREQAGLFAGEIVVEQADARQPWGITVDAVITSPPYGCEMSASPRAKKTLPYRLRELPHDATWDRYLNQPTGGTAAMLTFHYGQHPAQIGTFRGRRYWEAMRMIYTQAHAAIREGGQLILIVKDHIRDGQRVLTADRTITLCQDIGFHLAERFQRRVHPLSLWQRRRKEQGLPVVEEEDVLVLRKGERVPEKPS